MQPRLTLVTLGVADLAKSRAFYEAWGWKASSASQPECRVLPGEWPRARSLRPCRSCQGCRRRGQAHGLCRHHARLQCALERRGRRGLCACGRSGRASRQAAAGCFLGRLFGLFRRSRRTSLGSRLESVLSPRRTGPHVPAGYAKSERASRPAPMGRYGSRSRRLRGGGVSRRRPRGARHRRESAHCDALPDPGQPRHRGGARLHPVLHDGFHLRRPRRRGRLSCRAVQHRRRGTGDAGGPRRRARRSTISPSCRASCSSRSASWALPPSAPPGPRCPAICRPSAAATSSSRRSCSTGSPAC